MHKLLILVTLSSFLLHADQNTFEHAIAQTNLHAVEQVMQKSFSLTPNEKERYLNLAEHKVKEMYHDFKHFPTPSCKEEWICVIAPSIGLMGGMSTLACTIATVYEKTLKSLIPTVSSIALLGASILAYNKASKKYRALLKENYNFFKKRYEDALAIKQLIYQL